MHDKKLVGMGMCSKCIEEEKKIPLRRIVSIIDHGIIKQAIENNWFETDPNVSDDEVSDMAIGIAGEVDKFIRERDVFTHWDLVEHILYRDLVEKQIIKCTCDESFTETNMSQARGHYHHCQLYIFCEISRLLRKRLEVEAGCKQKSHDDGGD